MRVLSAKDLPWLNALHFQLSLAVSQNPDAQRTILNVRRALEAAESVTPGLMNAFATEIFHTMAEVRPAQSC